YPMPQQKGLRFSVTLPKETVTFPRQAIDLADGSYFIWPVNLDLDGTRLRYATAQPLARLDQGKAGITYVFAASHGIPVEFAFDANAKVVSSSGHQAQADGYTVVDAITPGTSAAITVAQARPVTIVVLTEEQARHLTIGHLAGQRRMVLSAQQTWFSDAGLELRADGNAAFRFAVFPALATAPKVAGNLKTTTDGVFQSFDISLPARAITATVTPVREARATRPIQIGGLANAATQPAPEAFGAAAAWRIAIPDHAGEALINLDFVGDIGRLYAGTRLLDDWYYSGYGWQYALKHAGSAPLTLSVLPLRADAPIYLPKDARPDFAGKAQLAVLRGVHVTPVYRLSVQP
ncbi:MAG: glycoside hydrolase family 35, partial [Massilia sp.]